MQDKEKVISTVKEWASPMLIGLVGILLWRDITEMRADVKLLLTNQSADRVKIEQLESDVSMLKNYVFTTSKPASSELPSQTQEREQTYYIKPENDIDYKRK